MLLQVMLGVEIALAWFFASSACAAILFVAIQPVTRRWLCRPRRASAAFALRIAPAGLAIGCVFGLVVPAFVWLEPFGSAARGERLGTVGLTLAASGALLLATALVRGCRAVVRTRRHMRALYASGARATHAGSKTPVFVSDSSIPCVVLDGLVRPRLVVSRAVADVLTPEELERAVAHELAHHRAQDNLKRLMLAFVPDLISQSGLSRELEAEWKRRAELEADAVAAQGSATHAVALASALVKVARLSGGRPAVDLGRAAFHGNAPVAERIRTLCEGPATRSHRRPVWILAGIVMLVAAAASNAAVLLPAVHRLTEFIVRLP